MGSAWRDVRPAGMTTGACDRLAPAGILRPESIHPFSRAPPTGRPARTTARTLE